MYTHYIWTRRVYHRLRVIEVDMCNTVNTCDSINAKTQYYTLYTGFQAYVHTQFCSSGISTSRYSRGMVATGRGSNDS